MTPRDLAARARFAAVERLGCGADDIAICVLACELLAELALRLDPAAELDGEGAR